MRPWILPLVLLLPACFNPDPIQEDETEGATTTPLPGTTSGDASTSTPPSEDTTTSDPASTTDPGTSTGPVDPDTGSSGPPPDPCLADPCVNGTCVPQGRDPSCECEEGWAGDVCDACDDGWLPQGDECVLPVTCAADPCGPGATCDDSSGAPVCSRTFVHTGADQLWAVPMGVTSLDVVARGASGGCPLAGLGGEASATVTVMPGEMLHVQVGGVGQCGVQASLPGGYNGGGDKFTDAGDSWQGGSGGGGTDLRLAGNTLGDRILVAGGGGGQGWGGQAGHGGGENGETCNGVGGGCGDPTCGGGGGTQVGGGTAGHCNANCIGQPGLLGIGGTSDGCAAAGGGGGGGYYGGGGGAHCSGGGGSSRVDFPGNSDTATSTGVHAGDGELSLTWTP